MLLMIVVYKNNVGVTQNTIALFFLFLFFLFLEKYMIEYFVAIYLSTDAIIKGPNLFCLNKFGNLEIKCLKLIVYLGIFKLFCILDSVPQKHRHKGKSHKL